MGFRDYGAYDGLGLAELVARGEVSAQDLADEALGRIARVEPALGAVTVRLEAVARSEAAAPPAGPFRGVPFALKDLIAEKRGVPMTSGSRFMAGHVGDHDTELVRRYYAAGLVIVARTKSPELGLTPYTEPAQSGPTGTPWAPERSAGGSSGGAAALVAAGALPMAHGGDGGGSIRIPASCCGVFGLKPSRGRTPTGPDVGEHWLGLAVEHALTRSVRDSAALLDATSAPDPGAPYPAPPPPGPFLAEASRAPGRLTIAVTTDPFLPATVDRDVVSATEDAARLCRDLGHAVEPAAPALDKDDFTRAFITVVAAETAAEVAELERRAGRRARPGELEPATQLVAMTGRSLSAASLSAAVRELRRVGRLMGDFHTRYDLLLTPTLSRPPPLHGTIGSQGLLALVERALARLGVDRIMRLPGLIEALAREAFGFIPWTPLANVTGAPAMSVPLWWNAQDLPVGVMFSARTGDEATLLRLAAQLEAARPWAKRRPKVHAFDPA
jgi:amidase